jgi:endonuclease YncB( thermonuclease family)
MRRIIVSALSILGFLLVSTPIASANHGPNCTEPFEEIKAFLVENLDEWNVYDANDDGFACQSTHNFTQKDIFEAETPKDETETWTVTNVVDGDTIDVTRGDVEERIRYIGIDTPERGECGFNRATDFLTDLAEGEEVTLTAGARDDQDKYDRLLRYVDLENGTDTGLALIDEGLAVARYDSRDGYGEHDRETEYIAADESTAHVCDDAEVKEDLESVVAVPTSLPAGLGSAPKTESGSPLLPVGIIGILLTTAGAGLFWLRRRMQF